MFRFRFRIEFYKNEPYIGNETYETRHECCVAARELIEYIKQRNPALARKLCGFTYHGWSVGEPEPAWR